MEAKLEAKRETDCDYIRIRPSAGLLGWWMRSEHERGAQKATVKSKSTTEPVLTSQG